MTAWKRSTPKAKRNSAANSAANLGFAAKLWLAADKLRNIMAAAEYKHVVLGLIFLKYVSDSFKELRTKLLERNQSLRALFEWGVNEELLATTRPCGHSRGGGRRLSRGSAQQACVRRKASSLRFRMQMGALAQRRADV